MSKWMILVGAVLVVSMTSALSKELPPFFETGCDRGACTYQDKDGSWHVKPDPKYVHKNGCVELTVEEWIESDDGYKVCS